MLSLAYVLRERQRQDALARLQRTPIRYPALVPTPVFLPTEQRALEELVAEGLVQVRPVRRGWFLFRRFYWEYTLA